MEDFDAGAERVGERGQASRQDHEFLKSTLLSACAPPLRMFSIGGQEVRRFRAGQTGDMPVRGIPSAAAPARAAAMDTPSSAFAPRRLFVGDAVKFDQRLIQPSLVEGLALDGRGDLAVDVSHSAPHTFAEISRLVAVAARGPRARRSTARRALPPARMRR